jgi:hypothetical protein
VLLLLTEDRRRQHLQRDEPRDMRTDLLRGKDAGHRPGAELPAQKVRTDLARTLGRRAGLGTLLLGHTLFISARPVSTAFPRATAGLFALREVTRRMPRGETSMKT